MCWSICSLNVYNMNCIRWFDNPDETVSTISTTMTVIVHGLLNHSLCLSLQELYCILRLLVACRNYQYDFSRRQEWLKLGIADMRNYSWNELRETMEHSCLGRYYQDHCLYFSYIAPTYSAIQLWFLRCHWCILYQQNAFLSLKASWSVWKLSDWNPRMAKNSSCIHRGSGH
jgi:hypothetical protein